ncbi:MAG: hypothetical protein L0K95_13695 [Tetragenococcus koreensis]|nr:hypothetical protein [Tetragenococcus koreensis]MDN6580798.1 hypothetical protein [Tetragenococcus koreensis]MDN6734694.1 hypothetical protein [Tetragenococcus koreensis]
MVNKKIPFRFYSTPLKILILLTTLLIFFFVGYVLLNFTELISSDKGVIRIYSGALLLIILVIWVRKDMRREKRKILLEALKEAKKQILQGKEEKNE